jgi:hypothetical protein
MRRRSLTATIGVRWKLCMLVKLILFFLKDKLDLRINKPYRDFRICRFFVPTNSGVF